jgi:hypothetical protein
MKKTCTISAHKACMDLFINDNFGAGAMPGQDGAFAVGHIAAQ